MAHLMDKKETNQAILYRLECISGFSMAIQIAMTNGLDLSEYYHEIESADRLFAELNDIADDYMYTLDNSK